MTLIRMHDDVLHIQHGEEHLLLDQRDGAYYLLNSTAAALIGPLTAGATPQDLADTLAGHHRIDPQRARSDVTALLATLHTDGLTTTAAEEAGR